MEHVRYKRAAQEDGSNLAWASVRECPLTRDYVKNSPEPDNELPPEQASLDSYRHFAQDAGRWRTGQSGRGLGGRPHVRLKELLERGCFGNGVEVQADVDVMIVAHGLMNAHRANAGFRPRLMESVERREPGRKICNRMLDVQ